MRVNYYPPTAFNSFHLQMLQQMSNFNCTTYLSLTYSVKYTKVRSFFITFMHHTSLTTLIWRLLELSQMKGTLSNLCLSAECWVNFLTDQYIFQATSFLVRSLSDFYLKFLLLNCITWEHVSYGNLGLWWMTFTTVLILHLQLCTQTIVCLSYGVCAILQCAVS